MSKFRITSSTPGPFLPSSLHSLHTHDPRLQPLKELWSLLPTRHHTDARSRRQNLHPLAPSSWAVSSSLSRQPEHRTLARLGQSLNYSVRLSCDPVPARLHYFRNNRAYKVHIRRLKVSSSATNLLQPHSRAATFSLHYINSILQ